MTTIDDYVLGAQRNALGQPVGRSLSGWTPPPHPARQVLAGRYCRLEPIEERHLGALYAVHALDTDGAAWTYLPYGPFAREAEYREWALGACFGSDPLFFTIVDAAERPVGVAAYLRIVPAAGCIEVGHLNFSPLLQRTPAATEAMYLMMKHAFELGYRRYEWKCDVLNLPSRAAALRLGFKYEGLFRQAIVYKGRNRDTAWFSVLDVEWPMRALEFERWLDPSNFDAAGRQRRSLRAAG